MKRENMNKRFLSIKKEGLSLSIKDLIIVLLFSLLLPFVLSRIDIIKEFNFLIFTLIFGGSMTVGTIIYALINDYYNKKEDETLKHSLKKLSRLYSKIENSPNEEVYKNFHNEVIKLIPNNAETKSVLRIIAKKENLDFSLSIWKVTSTIFTLLFTYIVRFFSSIVIALGIVNSLDNITIFGTDGNSIFVLIFAFSFLTETVGEFIKDNSVFGKAKSNKYKRMCEIIIEILEESKCDVKENKTVKVQKIYCRKHCNKQTLKNGIVIKKVLLKK